MLWEERMQVMKKENNGVGMEGKGMRLRGEERDRKRERKRERENGKVLITQVRKKMGCAFPATLPFSSSSSPSS